MSKKVQKTLTAALATTLATGSIAIPAMAETKANIDDLYKAAYEATIKTQDLDKVTQGDINVAREAIDAIRGTSVESAVPTFSAIVDKAQQKFLEVAYNSIVKCQETGTQKDINTARTNIKDLPLQFKNPYSMAIDVVQQKVIDKVYAAVEEAIKSQKPEDIKKAQALLDDILTVVENDGVKKWAVETEVRFKKATAVLNIVSAEALNNNSVRIVFNRPIDAKSVIADNFSVTPKGEAYNNLIVNTAKVSEDGMSVDITTINAFANKADYVVNVSNLKDTFGNAIVKDAKAEFHYEIAAVKSIEFTASNIPTSADLKNYVVIKDALGRNVTDEYKDKLSFTSSNLSLVHEDGTTTAELPSEGKNTVIVGVTVDGTDVKASKTLTITETAATKFDGYTLVKTNYEIGDKTLSQIPEENRLSYVTVGETDVKLILGFKDQFGKELKVADTSDFVVEQNYNPQIAIVNSNGTITALSTGTAYVKVKYGSIEKTISIAVQAASLPNTISTTKNDYNLVATNEAGINIDYVVNDQYGSKYNGNKDVTTNGETDTDKAQSSQQITNWTIKNSAGNIVDNFVKNDNDGTGSKFKVTVNPDNGQISISPIEGQITTGTYKLTVSRKFKYQGNDTTINKEININVVEGGELAGYKVQIDHTKLDISDGTHNQTGLQKTAKVTVYEVDSANNEIGKVDFASNKASLEVLNSNGNDVSKTDFDEASLKNGVLNPKSDGTYTVNVKVGTVIVKQITITVIKTVSEPSSIQLSGKTVTINDTENKSSTTIADLFNKDNLNAIIKNQYGETIPGIIKKIKYTLANESGIKKVTDNDEIKFTGFNNNGVAVNKGTVDVVVSSIDVNYGKDNTQSKTIYYNTPLVIKVTINPAKAVVRGIASNLATTVTNDSLLSNAVISGGIVAKDQYGRSKNLDMGKVKIYPVQNIENPNLAIVDAQGKIVGPGSLKINSIYYNGQWLQLENKTDLDVKIKESVALNKNTDKKTVIKEDNKEAKQNADQNKVKEKTTQETNQKK